MDSRKEILLTNCKTYLDRKCVQIREEIAAINESASSETKSSMGDKYETGREMMMQERGKQYEQLELMGKHRNQLEAIDGSRNFSKAQVGALVETDFGVFFISVAVGLVKEVDPKTFFLSPVAPLSQAMSGMKAGDSFTFGKRTYLIRDIC